MQAPAYAQQLINSTLQNAVSSGQLVYVLGTEGVTRAQCIS